MKTIQEAQSLLFYMRETKRPDDSLVYGQSGVSQMVFFRDRIATLFSPRKEEETKDQYEDRQHFCKIRGFHTSKSVKLPVYWFKTDKIEIIARGNFYNWNVSVRSEEPIQFDAYLNVDKGYDYCFCEGMEDAKFQPYLSGRVMNEFTFCKWSNEELFAVMWNLASQVG